jgi:hypothetical protein
VTELPSSKLPPPDTVPPAVGEAATATVKVSGGAGATVRVTATVWGLLTAAAEVTSTVAE